MPYANLEERKAYAKRYYSSDDQKQKAIQRQCKKQANLYTAGLCYRCGSATNSDKTKCEACREEQANYARKRYARVRKATWEHYGAVCAWCGEDDPNVLEVDHINNDGIEHRRKIGDGASAIYAWLVRNGFPDGFQLLCTNCNTAKERKSGGVCPPWRHNKYIRLGQVPADGEVVSCSEGLYESCR